MTFTTAEVPVPSQHEQSTEPELALELLGELDSLEALPDEGDTLPELDGLAERDTLAESLALPLLPLLLALLTTELVLVCELVWLVGERLCEPLAELEPLAERDELADALGLAESEESADELD